MYSLGGAGRHMTGRADEGSELPARDDAAADRESTINCHLGRGPRWSFAVLARCRASP